MFRETCPPFVPVAAPAPVAEQADKRRLFADHLGLVHAVVSHFARPDRMEEGAIERSDLLQFGMLGLLDAIEKFDPSRGVQFSTYAVRRIRGAVQDELRKLDWLPRTERRKERERETNREAAGQEFGEFSDEAVAARLAVSVAELRALMASNGRAGGEDVLDRLEAGESEGPDALLEADERRELVVGTLGKLPERERLIVMLYYYEELTFREIAGILRISEARVSQIHGTVLRGLKRQLEGIQ